VTRLVLDDVTRHFGGVTAVSKVSLDIRPGARHVIFGPNGAGKTTLFRLISGEIPPSSGTIQLGDRDVTKTPAWQRTRLGLGRTFQVTNLFPELTVLENVLLALQAQRTQRFWLHRERASITEMTVRAHELLEEHGIEHRTRARAGQLAYGEQRILEIILAVAGEPSILLLDEPTAGLPVSESAEVIDHVRALDKEMAVVLIEHDLSVAFGLAITATVLGQGRVVADGTIAEVRDDPMVQELYLGKQAKS
jgi:branched-chain amino acid transport system ATP-binding protein